MRKHVLICLGVWASLWFSLNRHVRPWGLSELCNHCDMSFLIREDNVPSLAAGVLGCWPSLPWTLFGCLPSWSKEGLCPLKPGDGEHSLGRLTVWTGMGACDLSPGSGLQPSPETRHQGTQPPQQVKCIQWGWGWGTWLTPHFHQFSLSHVAVVYREKCVFPLVQAHQPQMLPMLWPWKVFRNPVSYSRM